VSAPILLIDNYDSFVYNLARYFQELGCRTEVIRNDAVTVPSIRALAPAAIVLSPGPCTPREAGVCIDVVRQLGPQVPMLGVCLGHQAIAAALGGDVLRDEPVHGRTSEVWHEQTGLFEGLPNPLTAARYHSLVVAEESLPASLQVTARTQDHVVMALQHSQWPLYGVQFHPESVLTDSGHRLLANFLRLAGVAFDEPASQEMTADFGDNDFFARSIEIDHPPPHASVLR
jgi:anthranilate synthase/aminodeoxychorismate synthase-like glutamine amidotransferase